MRNFFTSPLGWVFLAGLWSWVWPRLRPRRVHRRPAPLFNPFTILAWGMLFVFSTPLVGTILDGAVVRLGQRWPAPSPAGPGPPQAILVFTGGLLGEGEKAPLNGASLERLLAAAEAARTWPGAAVVFSGGPARGSGGGAARAMAAAAGLLGLAPERVVVESASRTTRHNAVECARIARERGWTRVVLVTSPGHMARARGALFRAGVASRPFPAPPPARGRLGPADLVPSVEALAAADAALHEMIGLAWYRLRGWA